MPERWVTRAVGRPGTAAAVNISTGLEDVSGKNLEFSGCYGIGAANARQKCAHTSVLLHLCFCKIKILQCSK